MDKKSHEHENIEQQTETDVQIEETPAFDRIKELEDLLAVKEAAAADNWDKFLRERADMENYRKRTQKEKEEIQKYGNEALILEILPAVDNLERALDHVDSDNQDSVVIGVKMTLDMLVSALKKFGVKQVDSEKGSPFNSAIHQAMGHIESDEYSSNTIAEVFQKGYTVNERLLRPAMVMVVK